MQKRTLILSFLVCNIGLFTQALAGQELQIVADQRGFLGVSIREVTSEDVSQLGLSAEKGVYINNVEPESPAEAGGIKVGDVITKYQGIDVLSARQFQRIVADTPPGRTVEMEVNRNGQVMHVNAEIGNWSATGRFHGRPPQLEGRLFRFPEGEFDTKVLPNERFFHYSLDPKKPRLGINATALTDQMADFLGVSGKTGVLVLEVVEGSKAQEAGLKAGDVITSVGGESVENVGELRARLCDCKLEIELLRKGSVQVVAVDLENKEKDDGNKKQKESSRI
jgi:serine protease Do